MYTWIIDHYIELFGAVTGILYVILEVRQNTWLWPVGIITSAVYIIVFFNTKFYADMGLQVYYLFISIYGWYFWVRGPSNAATGSVPVASIRKNVALVLAMVFIILFVLIWLILLEFTDSPVPGWDSFTTSVSIIATWMLARKIIEHWYLWIIADMVSMGLYIFKGMYPTVVLFALYTAMAFVGLQSWKKDLVKERQTYHG